jgi:hypothetical protein
VVEPRVVYVARNDTSPDVELDALASAYRFILDGHAKKKAARTGGPDDAEDIENARTAIDNCTT